MVSQMVAPQGEESPSIVGQSGREILPKATLGKVQQKITAVYTARVKRRGKSTPAVRRRNWPCKPHLMQETRDNGLPVRPLNR